MAELLGSKPWIVAFILALSIVCGYEFTIAPPRSFTPGSMLDVERGSTLAQVAEDLGAHHIILYPVLFEAVMRLSGQGDAVKTGLYKFDTPANLVTVAYRLVTGSYGIPPSRITFIEGMTNADAATQVAQALPGLSVAQFLSVAAGQQGYLFPDTYFFQPGVDAAAVVAVMRSNFEAKITPLRRKIMESGHSISDVIQMAAIIEKEAKTTADKHIIAGILWHRLDLAMPLQVDAAKETYAHNGFPREPICNPGLDSIEAAIAPTKTNYLYYLTGNDGLMHYATTYAGHQANLRKYLR